MGEVLLGAMIAWVSVLIGQVLTRNQTNNPGEKAEKEDK